MLIIRAQQMKALEQDRARQFKLQLRAHLEPAMPSTVDLDALIDRGMADAPEFGLAAGRHVAQFVEVTGRYLGGFPDGPLPVPALAILMAHGMDPSIKLSRYVDWARAGRPAPPLEMRASRSDAFREEPVGATVQRCPLDQDTANRAQWIEIELIGEDDQPIAWEEYLVELPDGTRVRGFLDEEGSARLSGFSASGTCKVCFPNLDRDAWELVSPRPEEATRP